MPDRSRLQSVEDYWKSKGGSWDTSRGIFPSVGGSGKMKYYEDPQGVTYRRKPGIFKAPWQAEVGGEWVGMPYPESVSRVGYPSKESDDELIREILANLSPEQEKEATGILKKLMGALGL